MTSTVAANPPYPGEMTTAATTRGKLPMLTAALRGQVVDGIRIHDAVADLTTGAVDDVIVRLTLLLDDPEQGRRTWPLDAIRAMESRAWDEAAALGIPE